MGFHWKALGYESTNALREAMGTDAGQLDAFVRFVKADRVLVDALHRRDWHAFAARYNGLGQVERYAGLMAAAYERNA
jgi:hypothetical protein